MRIIVTIEDGLVQGVLTDADAEDVSVSILDYDVLEDWDADAEERTELEKLDREVEAGIASGKLVNRW